jgi:anthranilate phosphoribosyltransferase
VLNPARAPAAVQGVFHPPYRALQQAAGMVLGQQGLCILKGGGGEFERNPGKEITLFRLQDGQPAETPLPPLVPEARRLAEPVACADALGAVWRGTLQDHFAEAIVTGTAAAALIALGHAPDAAQIHARALWQNRLHPSTTPATARSLTP